MAVVGIDRAPFCALQLCQLNDVVRRELVGNRLQAFEVGVRPGAHTDHVERLLLWLGRFGLADLALRPMLCVALCAVYASETTEVQDIGTDSTGGRHAVFGKIVEMLLKGAAQRDTAVAVERQELRDVLEEYTGLRMQQHTAPAPSLESLVVQRLAHHKPGGGSDAEWQKAVRLHLYASGLLIPAGRGEPTFAHETLRDYLAARYLTRAAPLDVRTLREVAKDSRTGHDSYALFRAAPLLAERPEVFGALFKTWRTAPRRDAAVLVAKLCAEAAPVPEHLRARAAAVLTEWGRTAKGATRASLSARPDDQEWAHWARRQGQLLAVALPPRQG